jgi:hypothetical protein
MVQCLLAAMIFRHCAAARVYPEDLIELRHAGVI